MPSANSSSIYLDNAATTPLDPRVLEAMLPYLTDNYGNPSSIHSFGQEAKNVLQEARAIVSTILECTQQEIIFTGSGTESNNLALFGISEAYGRHGKHIIISSIEHHSVLNAAQKLEQQGFIITYLPVNQYGQVSPNDLIHAITKDTILVSIIYANNEIGTIQNISEIGRICRQYQVIFHTDACQATGSLTLNVNDLNCDLLSINGSKLYGPKGIGALYLRKGLNIAPQILGGNQESKRRAGTENIASIKGLATALQIADAEKEANNQKIKTLRDLLLNNLFKKIPNLHLNGHPEKRLVNNINVSFHGLEGESLILRLDMEGIAASTGAACTTASVEPSHVLKAIGLDNNFIYGSLRLTLGKNNTLSEIEKASEIIPQVVRNLQYLNVV